MSKEITLSRGQVALVDDDMFETLSQFRWSAVISGSKASPFYARHGTKVKQKYVETKMHHAVIGFPLNRMVVDHINGDGLDNRRENLRVVSHRQNMSNTHYHRSGAKSSRFIGVARYGQRFTAQVQINGVLVYLGSFSAEEDAAAAYRRALAGI